MDNKKQRVVFKINGEQIPFLVDQADLPFFSDAKSLIDQRMGELGRKHAAYSHTNKLLFALAVESLVDGLKVNDKYHRLRTEVELRLEDLHKRFEDQI